MTDTDAKEQLREVATALRSRAEAIEEDEGRIHLVDEHEALAERIDDCIQDLEAI